MGDVPAARRIIDPIHGERDEHLLQTPHYGSGPSLPMGYQHQSQYTQQNAMPLRSEAFNMTQLSGALPSSQDFANQRYSSTSSTPNYQLHNDQTFASNPINSQGHNLAYVNAFSAQYPGQYATSHGSSSQNMQSSANAGAMYYPSGYPVHAQQQPQNYYLQHGQYLPQSPVFSVMPGAQQYASRGSFAGSLQPNQQRNRDHPTLQTYGQQGRSSSIASSSSSVVRGPPRKPRQSGHAIWIGNLPPQTALMDLVHHVCKETMGLESLFLISKSNCAFANFKDDTACAEAQAKIHDSRFQAVRLVSRLRRNSTSTPTSTTGVSLGQANSPQEASIVEDTSPSSTPELQIPESKSDMEGKTLQEGESSAVPTDKFFIVKSLTVEDLELSVRNGIWATQSHNEEALNKAFKQAENVYLVFSANKSGEYFGYARMISPINDDPAAAIEFAPKAQPVEDPTGELPKAIATSANEFTPKGRIIDDSARGTIFWEAEKDDSEEEEEDESAQSEQDGVPPEKAWGKPFKVEWVSTTRLPFYKTRGLRNPWNSNREVKIARDGTELETSVGKRLLGLFHRVPSPIGPIPQVPTVQLIGGYQPHLQRYQ